jgi:diguanylate cyclase (GGDEF)-like protein
MRGVLVDVTERKDLEGQLTRHAFYDSLTGLPNRALFMDRVQEAIARASRRSEGMIGVLFIDIDDFKVVNDTLGHIAGDALLGEIGKRLTAGLRLSDTSARFGGDEFTVLLDELHGPDEALQLAARLADRVAEPVRIDGRDIVVTVSIGIGITADVEITAPDLVRQADIAMYRAKENGKARVELFDVAMSAEAWQRLDLQRDLRQAVQRGELSVYYQPVVELETGCIKEVEALVRWEHPQRGMLLPGDFIPFAEATGLITQIDNLVLRQAARQVSAWQRRFEAARSLMLAVNVSPLDFREAALVDQVVQVLRDTGLPASSLTVELTEGASMPGQELVTAAIARLSALGVRVVIDDFGVGFGGLDYVKRFRVHGLKIDRSFVEGIADGPEDAAVVGAMLAFGNALGLSVVAEGIETADQLAVLRRLGCDRGQGYLLARPMPPEAIEEMLTRNLSLLPPVSGQIAARTAAAR